MSRQCAVCGHEGFAGDRCPRCGSPVEPSPVTPAGVDERTVVSSRSTPAADPAIFRPDGPAAPARAGAAVPDTRPPTPAAPRPTAPAPPPTPSAPAPGVAPPVRRRRAALITGVAVAVVLAIAAGVALAAPYLGSVVPSALRPEDPRVALVTQGSPPARSAWQAGYRELWRVDPDARIEAAEPGIGPSSPAYAARTADLFAFTSDTYTASGSLLTVSAKTGRTVRLGYAPESCRGLVAGDLLRCQGGRMGYYPTDLVDLASGDPRTIPTSQELGAEIPDGAEDVFGWTTYVVDGMLLASWTTEPGEEGEPQHGNVARINDAGTAFAWRTSYDWHGAARDGRVQHGILTDLSFAVDAGSGTLVATSTDGSPVQWVAQDVLQVGSGSTRPEPVVAPDGAHVTTIGRGALPVTTAQLPRHPLRHVGTRLEAFDPGAGSDAATGPALWSCDLGVAAPTEPDAGGDLVVAAHDGLLAVVQAATPSRAAVEVFLLDEASGALRWRTTVGRPLPGGTSWEALPAFTTDGSVLVQTVSREDSTTPYGISGARLVLLDPATSRPLWGRRGVLGGYPDSAMFTGAALEWRPGAPLNTDLEAYQPVLVDNLDDTWSLLAPRPLSDAENVALADAPPCPDGMSPVSFTRYADGAVLLCRQGDAFAVVLPAHPDWWANRLTFTGGGYEVVFSNHVVLRSVLGGTMVYLDENGVVSAHPATGSWNSTTGPVSAALPTGLPSCPAGSWPISLSTFDGGWLLVCGTAADQASRLLFSEGGTVAETGEVTVQPGAYCGTVQSGTVCAYRAPAVVTLTPASGSPRQHSVTQNYYDGYGQGGAGEGTGSYGVNVPDATAKDQVRYLTQILQKSMTGRSSIDRAVALVRRCTSLDEAVATIDGVTANREELLDALDSAPVDAVPDGTTLVEQLRTALRLSHDSDLVWAQWARSEQAGGCAEGEDNPLYRQVTRMNLDVSAAKDDFLAEWNSRIAPAYDAPEFHRSQI